MFVKGNQEAKKGSKGNKGRKTKFEEWNKAQTTYKAWEKVDKEVSDNLNVATQIVLKDMATKVSNPDGSNLELQTVLVKFISDEKDRDNNRGSD
jgi:hypothetical protein